VAKLRSRLRNYDLPFPWNPLIHELSPNLSLHSRNTRILLHERDKFIYYRIPKSGNSTVVKTLFMHDPSTQQGQRESYSSKAAKTEYGSRPSDFIWRPHHFDAYFRFTFVRNPFHRVLSAYRDKVSGGKKAGNEARKRMGADSFPEFVAFLETGGGLKANAHWAPQVWFVPERLDFVGKIETMSRDLQNVLSCIWPDILFSQVFSHAPHATAANVHARSVYTEGLIERVVRLYRHDFEAFQYDLSLP
jgi:hypothetical protein